MANNFKMLAKTMYGFEDILAAELKALGAMNVETGVRSVSFEGDTGFMYKANLSLRTAIKILKPIRTFFVRGDQDLYDKVYRMEWERHMKVSGTFAIDATVNSDLFNHSKYVALKTKDAIVDRFRNILGKRPDVDVKYPDLRIHIHIQRNQVTISLDSSGQSLHQRGYKTATNIAPINEILAAGMLLQSGWDGQCDFLDPMCGSGTLLIEAAMIACNIPANINRREFAFEKWPDYDQELFDKIVDSSLNKTREFHHKIYGFDKAPSAVHKANDNVKNANLSEYIQVQQQDFFESDKPVEGHLHMVFNPPYGERLNINMPEFYRQIGDTLKNNYPDTEAWFITADLSAFKHVGLRPSRKIKLFNGKLESRLYKYEIYAGSKKAKFN
ncbi:class I SAM-dependent RNA methyltransferase [Robertkochia marina]|uniref:Class I SAM-dependent RNA methyltransferase n=1 Tax=Robertkochia marina TaxID=1227945 RepID=A0A4S3LZE2_9FLAO|nr:THUMP domain-containing protein [Robertkochia marina]THD66511.1 class I SAM-dependent RNA methyltransferase [Robertkochia marina]TRZ45650.1 class I SAM-dependent RNA methyltransferase [Robertkochia marina]